MGPRARPGKYAGVAQEQAVELRPLKEQVDADDDDEHQTHADRWLSWAWYKLTALLWVSVGVGLAYYIKLPHVVVHGYVPEREDRPMNRFYFNIGLAGFGVWALIAAYLIVWVNLIQRSTLDWEEHSPYAIPIATVSAICSLAAFCVAFWPIWGLLTLPIVFFLFLGALNASHFSPL